MAEFTSEYEDVLQNIEFGIVSVHRNLSLVDSDVMEALEALITWFKRVGQGREQQTPRLSDRAQRVFVEVREICQWRMGMVSLSPNLGKLEEGSRICTADEIVACLKKILKSVTRWNREYGRQGYLNFAGRFIE